MQMHEPQQFDLNAAIGGYSNPTSDGSTSVLPVLVLGLSALAWVFMNIWSVNLVASGIWAVKLFPPSFSENMVMLFALALQSIPALFGLLTPQFFARWGYAAAWPLTLALCIGVVGFEMYHSVLAQYKNSTGAALFAQERASITALDRKLTDTATQLTSTYLAKTKSYEDLADDAARGRDESGVAKCDKICKEFRRKYATAKSQYSHLSISPAAAPGVLPADADLREHFTDLESRSTKLVAAGKDLTAFYRALDNSAPPATLVDEIASIHTAIAAKAQRFASLHSLSPATLALEQTNAAFAALSEGRLPAAEARLPMVYGILPALCVLVLSLFIRVCLTAIGPRMGLGHLAGAIAKETIASRMLKRLEALRSNNFMHHLRAKYKRWDTI
jgi:hypothetical protein